MEKQNLYLIVLSNKDESFYKIGTSVHRYCRFYQIMKHGYVCTIKYMLMGLDCYDAMDAEGYLQNVFREHSYNPKTKFGGYRECFKDINIDDYKTEVSYLIPKSKEIVEDLEVSWR
jgi:hypothetical protein